MPSGKRTISRLILACLVVGLATLLTGCPLPYSFSGEGSGGNISSDPSSPKITAPVTFSYSDESGGSGAIPDGELLITGTTATVTLATATENAVIFYTDDGSPLTSLSSAKQISDSSGQVTVPRSVTLVEKSFQAVAVGPGMLPSPFMTAVVRVSPYPILTISPTSATISENGGTVTITITSSTPVASAIGVNLSASGDGLSQVTFTPALPAGLAAGATTTQIVVEAQHDVDLIDDPVTLTIDPDPSDPPNYTVGPSEDASVTVLIQDDMIPPTYAVAYIGNGNTGGTVPSDGNAYVEGATVTVLGNTGGLTRTEYLFDGWNTMPDGSGTNYTQGNTFAMGSSDVTLYAQWRPVVVISTIHPWVQPGLRPQGLAYDGTWLWINDVNDSAVYQIDPADGSAVASFPVPATFALAPDGAGKIWTTTFWADPPQLARYPMSFGAPDLTLTIATTMKYPTAMTYDPNRSSLWVVNTNDTANNPSRFWQLNPADGSVIDTWDLPGGIPGITYGICMDNDPNFLWMVAGSTLSKVSIPLKQVVLQYTIPTTSLLQGIALAGPDRFWMVDGNNDRIIEVQLQ